MHIPHFWAEAKAEVAAGKKTATLRRFGWSDVSEEEARVHAQNRVNEAVSQWQWRPKGLPMWERKVPYNGAEGLPIREEIIDEGEGYVITRNSYGALCLNTPNVLIADVDLPQGSGALGGCFGKSVALSIAVVVVGFFACSKAGSIPGLLMSILGGVGLSASVFMMAKPIHPAGIAESKGSTLGERHRIVRERVRAFLERHPRWGVRIYETPEGFRLIGTHSTMDPMDDAVDEFFQTVGADPLYVKMCRNQKCFRARLTAKPWRCGLSERMHPRSVWPIPEGQMPTRERWVTQYETAARQFASCRWLETLGPEANEPYILRILDIHDRLSQARSQLPIA